MMESEREYERERARKGRSRRERKSTQKPLIAFQKFKIRERLGFLALFPDPNYSYKS